MRESTASHSRVGPDRGYGYMWWTGRGSGLYPNVTLRERGYSAAGWGGHRLIVLPYRNLVVVHRVDTDRKGRGVSPSQIGRLLWHVLDAAGETDIGEKPTLAGAAGRRLAGEDLRRKLSGGTVRGQRVKARFHENGMVEVWRDGRPLDTAEWWVEGERCWLRGNVLTGGAETFLRFVAEGDVLKWYDRQGTLDGRGLLSRD